MASIAALMRLLRLTDRENSTPSSRQAAITFLVPNAESPRTMILPAPHLRVVVMACLTCRAAARPEPALPLRSRASAITGAAVAVEIVVICGDRPRRSSARPAILACPNEAPCLGRRDTGLSSGSIPPNARCSMSASSGTRAASVTRCARATAASWLAWPKVNSRKKMPNVDGAYTSSNTRGVPPARSTLTSSMQSAPHIMPATIEVNLPAGFTAPDRTRVLGSRTCSAINPERPVCSASSSTGTNPAADTRFRSSNTADPIVNVYDDCTENAFQNSGQTRPQQPQLSQFRRHFRCSHADQTTGPSTDSGLVPS